MSRIVTNDNVFTDTRTDRKWVDELINQLYEDGEIFSPSDMTTGVHTTLDEIWELTPKSLCTINDDPDLETILNPIFINALPFEIRKHEGDEEKALEQLEASTTNEIAEEVAESTEMYGNVQDEMGNFCDGYEHTALIVVHEDTTQLGGFIPLVRAFRKKQQEFPLLKPMRVFVHSGTRASLRPFDELPTATHKI